MRTIGMIFFSILWGTHFAFAEPDAPQFMYPHKPSDPRPNYWNIKAQKPHKSGKKVKTVRPKEKSATGIKKGIIGCTASSDLNHVLCNGIPYTRDISGAASDKLNKTMKETFSEEAPASSSELSTPQKAL